MKQCEGISVGGGSGRLKPSNFARIRKLLRDSSRRAFYNGHCSGLELAEKRIGEADIKTTGGSE